MDDFSRNLNLAQIAFGVIIIAVSLAWIAFFKDSDKIKARKPK